MNTVTEGTNSVKAQKLNDVLKAVRCLESILIASGWTRRPIGRTFRIDYDERFALYARRRNLTDLIGSNGEFEKMSPKTNSEKTDEIRKKPMVSNPALKTEEEDMTPFHDTRSRFIDYPSLLALASQSDSLVIGYDALWYSYDSDLAVCREIICWMFSLISNNNDANEFIFIRKQEPHLLNIETAIGCILDQLHYNATDIRSITRYASLGDPNLKTGKHIINHYSTKDEAASSSKYPFPDGQIVHNTLDWNQVPNVPVTLLCHGGKGSLSAFDQSSKYSINLLSYCTEVQDGLVTLGSKPPIEFHPASLIPRDGHHTFRYSIRLSISDTMCHAPADMKTIPDLKRAIGMQTPDIVQRLSTDRFLIQEPVSCLELAAERSTVPLLYAATLYGYNKRIPVTITSVTAAVMKESISRYLGCQTEKDFERSYRGLYKVSHRKTPLKRESKADGFTDNSFLEPISDQVNTLQYYFSKAYHGGYNSSSEIGFFREVTHDYDLKNAYPTAMALVRDIDWSNPVQNTIHKRELSPEDFRNPETGEIDPLLPLVAYVTFEFPISVKYPCIAVTETDIPIFPRACLKEAIYAAGPELYLALQLGAKVFCETGYVARTLIRKDAGTTSRSLGSAVKQMVQDRAKAKAEFGKGSLPELILKTMVNSGYGKTAQNVVQKTNWDAYSGEMVKSACSAITNPAAACMTTSITRALLIAAQNQAETLGYLTYSVTTDGFISNMPLDKLVTLDLYGLAAPVKAARLFLKDGESADFWEAKHIQNDLLNFTTRGNVSLNTGKPPKGCTAEEAKQYANPVYDQSGVCAHCNVKSGYPSDSFDDRLWLMKSVLSRTKPVSYNREEWTSFMKLVAGEPFIARAREDGAKLNFDMKRKPDESSFRNEIVTLDGQEYEIACFSTVPYEDIDEYIRYRDKEERSGCLRTMDDWESFLSKLKHNSISVKPRDLDRSILFTCIAGHRAGFWVIPKLNTLQGQERDIWINKHNTSGHVFGPDDWKNAGRSQRQSALVK